MSQVNIDFEILSNHNPKKLIVIDTSDWFVLKGKPTIIEITLPGSVDYVTHYFNQNEVNIFNSANLYLTCYDCDIKDSDLEDLPDGIYKITIKGSPSSFSETKYFIKTDNIRLKLDQVFSKTNLSYMKDDGILNTIQEIDFYINASESNLRLGNNARAQELLFKANKKISKLLNK